MGPEPTLQIQAASSGSLSCVAQSAPEMLTISLSGTADTVEEPILALLLERVHERARALRSRAVRVDLTALSFMSSSCFKDFVTWLRSVMDLPPAERYLIRFKSNPTFRWQRGSLNALSCFAVDLVTLE